MIFFNRISQTDVKQINNDDNRKPLVKGKVKDYARVVTVNDTKDAAVQVSDIKDLNIDDEQFEFNVNKEPAGNIAAKTVGTQPDNVQQIQTQNNINNTNRTPATNIAVTNENINNNTVIPNNKTNDNPFNIENTENTNNIVQDLIDNSIDDTKKWLGDFSGRIKNAIESLTGNVGSTVFKVTSLIENPLGGAKDAIGNLVGKVAGFVVNPLGSLGKLAAGPLVDLAKDLLGGLLDKVNTFLFGKSVEDGGNGRTWLGNVVDGVKDWVGNAIDKVNTFLFGKSVEDGGNGRTLLGKAVDWVKDKYDAANKWVGNIIDKVNTFLFGKSVEDGGKGRTFLGKVVDTISDGINAVKKWALGTEDKPTWLGKLFGYGKKAEGDINEYKDDDKIDDGSGNTFIYDATTDSWALEETNNEKYGDLQVETSTQTDKNGNTTKTQYEYINGKKVPTTETTTDKNGNKIQKEYVYSEDGKLTKVVSYTTDDAGNTYERTTNAQTRKTELTSVTNKNGQSYVVKNYLNNDGSLNWTKLQQDGWGTTLTGTDAQNAWADLQNGSNINEIIKKYKPNTINDNTSNNGSSVNNRVGSGGGGGSVSGPSNGGYCPDGSYSPIADSSGFWGPIMSGVIGVGGHGGGGGGWRNTYQ